MTRKALLPALLVLVPAFAAAQDAANQALRAEIANKVTAARQANAAAMQQYTWDQRTELLESGTVKDTRVEMVNWVNGAYQRSLVSNEGPSLPRFGIRKRIAEEKQKEMQQYMSGLKGQLEQYTMGTTPQLLGFFSKAQISGPDATGLVALSGGSVVAAGDSMTVWVNAATKKAVKAFIATTYQGDAVTMNSTFGTLPTGLDYTSFADIQIPGKQMEIQVSNFNYNRNN